MAVVSAMRSICISGPVTARPVGRVALSHVAQVHGSVCSCTGKLVRGSEALSPRRAVRGVLASCPMPLIDFTGRKRASALRLIGN